MASLRTTEVFLMTISEAQSCRQVPILVGNTGDVYASLDGPLLALPHLLAAQAAEQHRSTVLFSLARGSQDLTLTADHPSTGLRHVTTEDGAAPALTDLFAQLPTVGTPLLILVDYADLLLPPNSGSDVVVRDQERVVELLAEQALLQASGHTPHRLVILARVGAGFDQRLTTLPGFVTVSIGLPNREERRAVLRRLTAPSVGDPLQIDDGLDSETTATLTGGLLNSDLLHARNRSSVLGHPLDRSWIQARKSETIRRLAGDALIVYEPGHGMAEVAGLPQIQLIVKESKITGRPPRRILLAGPPGVGKTLVVRAIADELGVPAVALGNYRNPWVGETERRFRLALQVVRDLAPCVLHLDEIDQSVGQRTTGQSADSGTSERVLADMWAFLGDNVATPVTVIATTNRPELLDSAMFDRFEIVPVLHPTVDDAANVLRITAEREGVQIDSAVATAEVRRYGKLLTGRVLVDVMDRAITLAGLAGVKVGGEHLRAAFDELINPVPTREHEQLALRAIALTKFSSRLPWEAARTLDLPVQIPTYLTPYYDPSRNRVDLHKVADQLHA